MLTNKNLKKFKLVVKRLRKTALVSEKKVEKRSCVMWGVVTLEDIPAGAFLMKYTGEVVTKK